MNHLSDKLWCGHDRSCSYFHPGLRGSSRWRCSECDKIKTTEAGGLVIEKQPKVVREEPLKASSQIRPTFSMEMLYAGLKWGMIIGLLCGFCVGLCLGTIVSRLY